MSINAGEGLQDSFKRTESTRVLAQIQSPRLSFRRGEIRNVVTGLLVQDFRGNFLFAFSFIGKFTQLLNVLYAKLCLKCDKNRAKACLACLTKPACALFQACFTCFT